MKVDGSFRFEMANGFGYVICFDRKLTPQETACKTAMVADLVLNMEQTTNDRWMWTRDIIPDPDALAGEEIILL